MGTPSAGQRDREHVVTLMPIPARHRRAHKDQIDPLEDLRASAGSWKRLVDAERLKRQMKEARGSDRLDVTL
jgi:hypothetical protein